MFGFRYPAVVLLAGVIAGTALGRELDFGLPAATVLLLVAASFLLYAFLRLPGRYFIIPLLIMALSAAFLNANRTYRSFPADDIERYVDYGKKLRFFGEIAKWPVLRRQKTIIVCDVDSVAVGDKIENASGAVLIALNRETTHFALGDRISFAGLLEKPFSGGYPGQFDYSRHLKSKGIRGMVSVSDPAYILTLKSRSNFFGRSVNHVRQEIIACFRKNLTEFPAALASGFLIGETRDIPDEVYQAFRRTGTMHLLAVSGSNVALVLAVVACLLRFVPIQRISRLALMLIVIILFSHLSYNQPSVVRASVMAALILMAGVCYRRADMHNIIAAAAVSLIFYDPGNLYDIGFQLSFAVTWGLILFLPHINSLILARHLSAPVRYMLLVLFSSLIATLISAPITAYYFGEISLVTVFSNLLVVPLVSMAVIGIAVLLLVHLILPAAAIWPGILLDRLLIIINDLVLWFDQWKFATSTTGSIPAGYVYAVLTGVTIIILAISYRFMRRILVVYALVVSAYFTAAFALISPSAPPDIEIYNMGSSQTVIINRGVGAVIFCQNGEARYDAFNTGLLPYLDRRKYPMPRYFIFNEPRYRTEFRLHQASEKESTPAFRPFRIDADIRVPSIWTAGLDRMADTADTSYSFLTAPGLVEIRWADQGRLLFVDDLEAVNPIEAGGHDYYIVAVQNNHELTEAGRRPDFHNMIILLSGRDKDYPDLPELIAGKELVPIIVSRDSNPVYLSLSPDVIK